MYVIMVDDDILYHPLLVNEGRAVTSATVDVELDKTGSATITIPVSNVMYDSISKMKSMIQVLRDGEEIFRGRVLHDERDFNGNKEIYCEGELAFMIDNVLSPRSFNNRSVKSVFTEMVNVYNTQVEQTKQFTVGEVTVEGTVNYTSWDFAILWDEINERLVNVYGGHIRTRLDSQTGIRYIDYLADYSHVCDQAIEFGVNLLDFSEYISAEDLFTVLIPLGAKQEDADGNYIGRVNITSVTPGGHEYVSNRAAEDLFGNIWKINVWDDITDPNELKALGEAYLAKNLTEATTITITAIDLSLVDVDAEAIHIGDGIRVVSLPHNIDDIFQCSRISYDILSPQNSEYEFGKPLKSISQGQVDSNTSSSAAIAQSEARTDEALTEAKLYTDLEILKTTNVYESDRTIMLNETNLNAAYADLVDEVIPKQYRTSTGESRLKLGVVAEDLISAMNAAGLSDKPIITALSSGRYAVSYDEIVALLWKKIQMMQSEMALINGQGLWSVKERYTRPIDSIIISGSCRYVQGVCYNSSSNRVVFALIDGNTEGVLVETSLDLQTFYRKSEILPIGHANSITYVPDTDTILVATGPDEAGTYAYKIVAIDASALTISASYTVPTGTTPVQIAYDSTNDEIYCLANGYKLIVYNTSMVQQSIINLESMYDYVPLSTGQGSFVHQGLFYLIRSDQANERSYFGSYNLTTGAVKNILYIPTASSFEAEDGFSIGNDIYIIGGQTQIELKKIGLAEVVRRTYG